MKPLLKTISILLIAVSVTACTSPSPSAPDSTRISGSDGMPLIFIPEGEFLMGSDDSDPDAAPDEKPQHPVYLDAFWMDQTEVTNAMYLRCVDAGVCSLPVIPDGDMEQKPNHPIQGLAWTQAAEYCEWVGRRLPTEAEWEKAARGTDGRLYPWGNALPEEPAANFDFHFDGFVDVTRLPEGASPYGVLNMAGNTWEWTTDWYDENYYAQAPYENPAGPESGIIRVIRGGAWNTVSRAIRAANRHWAYPYRDDIVGFRCAMDEK
ncbi:MAG: hypothetical protein DPW18_13370 [Chloroflexi bacterium]|nr:hypothetical protein [Chloroflexota bacterium]MDL1943646.1 formylglycine-generating enzyme family protein [Chloroflexi bacterium CFX2]